MKCSICDGKNHTARTCPDKKCDNCGSILRDHPNGLCPKYECPHIPSAHRISFGKCVLLKCTICKAQNHTAATCPDKKCDNCGSFLRDHPDGVCPKKKYECPHTPLHRIAFGKCVMTGAKCTNCGSNTHKNSIKTPCLPVFVCPHEVLHHTFIECQRAHTVCSHCHYAHRSDQTFCEKCKDCHQSDLPFCDYHQKCHVHAPCIKDCPSCDTAHFSSFTYCISCETCHVSEGLTYCDYHKKCHTGVPHETCQTCHKVHLTTHIQCEMCASCHAGPECIDCIACGDVHKVSIGFCDICRSCHSGKCHNCSHCHEQHRKAWRYCNSCEECHELPVCVLHEPGNAMHFRSSPTAFSCDKVAPYHTNSSQ